MIHEETSGKISLGVSSSRENPNMDDVSLKTAGPHFPDKGDALIQPVREPGEESVTPTVVMTFTKPDYQAICRLSQAKSSSQAFGCNGGRAPGRVFPSRW